MKINGRLRKNSAIYMRLHPQSHQNMEVHIKEKEVHIFQMLLKK